MLRVTAILEGGLDLETGEEIPRSIAVSNGKTTVTIPVPNEKVQVLVSLLAEELGRHVAVNNPEPTKVASRGPAPHPDKPIKVGATRPLFEEEPEAPPMPRVDESGFEPGEEYDDSGTGVSSL